MTKKVLVCSSKGGVGKTTVSLLMANAFACAQQSVAFVDRDIHQKSSTRWFEICDNFVPETIQICSSFNNSVSHDIVFIDSAPRLESLELRNLMQEVDLIILVTSPSILDVMTAHDFSQLIRKYHFEDKAHLLFNRVEKRSTSLGHIDVATNKIGLPRLKHPIYKRAAYEHFMTRGMSAIPSKIKHELKDVVLEVSMLLSR